MEVIIFLRVSQTRWRASGMAQHARLLQARSALLHPEVGARTS